MGRFIGDGRQWLGVVLIVALTAAAASVTAAPAGGASGEGIAVAGQVNQAGDDVGEMGAEDGGGGGRATALVQIGLLALGVAAGWLFFAVGWHRLDRAPPRPQPLKPMIGAALLLAMLLLGAAGAQTAMVVFNIGAEDGPEGAAGPAVLTLGLYLAQVPVVVVFVFFLRRAQRGAEVQRVPAPRSLLIGAGALALFWPVANLAGTVAGGITGLITGRWPDLIAHETLALFLDTDPDLWLVTFGALIVLGTPLMEEVMYRGIVQNLLRGLGLGPWSAIIITTAVFAAAHVGAAPDPVALPGLLAALVVLSFGFGWVYERTGSLLAPIAMHALFNAANLFLVMVVAR